jgi:surface protein
MDEESFISDDTSGDAQNDTIVPASVSEDEDSTEIATLSDDGDSASTHNISDSDYYTVTIPQTVTMTKEGGGKGSGTYSSDFTVTVSDLSGNVASVAVTVPTEVQMSGSGYAETGSVTGEITSDKVTDNKLVANVEEEGTSSANYTASATLTPGDWTGGFDVEVEVEQKVAFAVYSADDNSLKFYKRASVPAVGDEFEGLTVTAVYEGVESDTYMVSTPWFAYREKIKSVDFVDTIQPIATAYWFFLFFSCTEINLQNLDTSQVTNFSYMFNKASLLTTIDVSKFDTSNGTNFTSMFSDCTKLTSLDVSNFNTSKATNLAIMFSKCSSLTTLDVSNFDTSNVTDMTSMFNSCSSLTSLNVTNFDTSKVTNMYQMFYKCSSLTTLDVSNFDTSKVTNMGYMFRYCDNLTTLDISGFDTSKVTTIYSMFDDCNTLQQITLGENFSFKGSETRSSYYAILPTPSSTYITGADGNWYDEKGNAFTPAELRDNYDGSTMAGIYYASKSLIPTTTFAVYSADDNSLNFYKRYTVPVVGDTFNGLKVTAIYTGIGDVLYSRATAIPWYAYRSKIQCVNIVDEIAPTYTKYWFYGLSYCTTIDLTKLNTINTVNLGSMFLYDYRLAQITLGENFSFKGTATITSAMALLPTPSSSYITDADGQWYSTNKLIFTPTELRNNYDGSTMAGTYYAVQPKTAFAVYSADDNSLKFYKRASVPAVGDEFEGLTVTAVYEGVENTTPGNCVPWLDNIYETITVDIVDNITPTSTSYWFYNAYNCTSMNLSKLDTSNVTDMSWMFFNCNNLTNLDVSNWNTSNVTNMESVFGCRNLIALDVSNWDTSKVTDMTMMFDYCSSLITLDVSNFNTSNVTSMSGMFSCCESLTTLDVSNFDTSNVEYMRGMFYACISLVNLDVSRWDTSNVTDMSGMFEWCASLIFLDLSNFNTLNVIYETDGVRGMERMFDDCTSLQQITLGEKFSFKGSVTNSSGYAILPTPDPTYITGADGNWYNEDKEAFTAEYLRDNYDGSTMAGTYYAVKPKTAFAVYSTDDYSLRFYNRSNVPASGDTFDGRTVKTVYTGIDSSIYTYGTGAPWGRYSGLITTVEVVDSFAPVSIASWFSGFTECTSIDVTKLDTNNVTSMSNAFYKCSKLTTLDLSTWDTSTVENMGNMFTGCTLLQEITLGEKWSFTSAVTDSSSYALLPTPDANYITDADGKWYDTANTTYTPSELQSSYNGSTMAGTYYAIKQAQAFAVYSADDNSLRFYKRKIIPSAGEMFNNLTVTAVYTEIETAHYNSVPATNGIPNYDAAWKPTNVPWYEYSDAIVSVQIVDVITPISTAEWFAYFSNCTSMNLQNLDTSKVTDMHMMFDMCNSLTSIDVSHFNTEKVTDMGRMFEGCIYVTELDLTNFNTASVVYMTNMFSACQLMVFLDISSFDVSKTQYMQNMFLDCRSLERWVLGEHWSFMGAATSAKYYATPQAPMPHLIADADYHWYDASGVAYTSSELQSSYDGATMAGTYYASKSLIPSSASLTSLTEDEEPLEETTTLSATSVPATVAEEVTEQTTKPTTEASTTTPASTTTKSTDSSTPDTSSSILPPDTDNATVASLPEENKVEVVEETPSDGDGSENEDVSDDMVSESENEAVDAEENGEKTEE